MSNNWSGFILGLLVGGYIAVVCCLGFSTADINRANKNADTWEKMCEQADADLFVRQIHADMLQAEVTEMESRR